MLKVNFTTKFKKDYKIATKRGLDIRQLEYVINELMNQRPLYDKYRDHTLSGNYDSFRECHIQPDWLLIYLIEGGLLTLTLVRTGTQPDL